jgi:hypothetical protein
MSELTLTDEQKQKILDEWNNRPYDPPSISELIRLAFGPDVSDKGTTKHARLIKSFLAERKIVPKNQSAPIVKPAITLTPEQEEYIKNNCQTMKAFEIAQILFNNPNLTNLHSEVKLVLSFIKNLEGVSPFEDPNSVEAEYKAPNTIDRAVARVNKYVHGCNYDYKTISTKIRKEIESLMTYLHDFRFVYQMETYDTKSDRELFESSFIKYTFDKPDLTKEDIDQYIMLCTEVVMASSIQRTINMLQNEQTKIVQEGGKMSMQLVEAINVARTEHNSSVQRQQKLFKALTEERSQRIQDQIKENATVLNLVQVWKEEEGRKRLIEYAEERKRLLGDEIEKLSALDETKARIFGLSRGEVFNG